MLNVHLCIYLAKFAIITLSVYGEFKNFASDSSLLRKVVSSRLSQREREREGDLDLGLISHL